MNTATTNLTDQQIFQAEIVPLTQRDRLERWLLAHPNQWFPMTELGAMIGAWAVHSRIAEVRRDVRVLGAGDIENRQTVSAERQRMSYYRYVPNTPGQPGTDNLSEATAQTIPSR